MSPLVLFGQDYILLLVLGQTRPAVAWKVRGESYVDPTVRKLQDLRKKMESRFAVEGRDIKTNAVRLLYEVAKALGYLDRIADQIIGDRLVNQPVFSRKRGAPRAPRALPCLAASCGYS